MAEAPSSSHSRRPRRGLRILGPPDDPNGEAAPLPIARRDPRHLWFPLWPPYSLPMAAAQDSRRGPAASQLLSLSSSRLWPRRRRLGTRFGRPHTSSAHESCDTRSQLLPDPPPDLAPTVGRRPPRCHGHRWRGGRGGAGRQEAVPTCHSGRVLVALSSSKRLPEALGDPEFSFSELVSQIRFPSLDILLVP